MSWIEINTTHGYANVETFEYLASEDIGGGTWVIRAHGATTPVLDGTYASQADADTAIKALVNGVTVADLT